MLHVHCMSITNWPGFFSLWFCTLVFDIVMFHCHQVGWETLQNEFAKIMEKDSQKKDHDQIFDQLKKAVRDASLTKHKWDNKAEDSLVSMPDLMKDQILW